MTRRGTERPKLDPAQDRAKWADLIAKTQQAVAEDTPDVRARLAERAATARNIWVPPAPYPAGLLVLGFAQLAYAWGRQADAGLRAAATPVLIQAAGVADQVIATAVAAEAAAATMPAVAGPGPAYRAPYADS